MEALLTDMYPSRVGSENIKITERKDPVVYGGGKPVGEYSLSAEEVKKFERDGFLLIPGLFPEKEIKNYYEEFEKLRAEPDIKNRAKVITEPDSNLVRSIFSVEKVSGMFNDLARDPRILDKIMQLLASEVYIHHSRINIKPAMKGKSFNWHSDFETWHVEDGMPNMRAISCSVFLTENTEFNGPLYVIKGSHKYYLSFPGYTPENNFEKSLKIQEFGSPGPAELQEIMKKTGGELVAAVGKPGTALLFDCNLMHGSPDNISPFSRSNFFMVYNSVKNRVVRPFSGMEPRPEYLSNRDFIPLKPLGK